MILNDLQQKFVDKAIDWFNNSSSTLLQLAGYAGTGKSVVIGEIIKRLHLDEDEILPMAYTGQACTIMRKRGFTNACTCHSALFTPIQEFVRDERGRIVMDKRFNTPILKWSFAPKKFTDTNVKLIVIDEAWMVPARFKKFIDDTGVKVLAAGDPGQLPPIAGNPGYLVDGDVFFLTELMRQSYDSPIVYLANRAREGYPIEPGLYGNDALVMFDDEFDLRMMAQCDINLCGRNATRDWINSSFRKEILHKFTDYPTYGERIICRKNNWGLEINNLPLVNGLVGTVVTPPSIDKFNGDTMEIDFLPDMTNHVFRNLEINYRYINADSKERAALKKSPFTEGNLFEYAYGSTVHLAQGSEYSAGSYLEEYVGDPREQAALNYTAITRFKNKMLYVRHRPKYWTTKTV